MARWTDDELSYLRMHANEGAYSIAEDLGRSVDSVRSKASEMGISVVERKMGWDLCPHCGSHYIEHGTAAARQGVCCTCWARRKAEATKDKISALRAEREAATAREMLRQERRRHR